MVLNKKLGDKFRRMPVIYHLWEIKEVEYVNLVNFIQKEKGELNSLEKSRSHEIKNHYNSHMHDLTFIKDKKNFWLFLHIFSFIHTIITIPYVFTLYQTLKTILYNIGSKIIKIRKNLNMEIQ